MSAAAELAVRDVRVGGRWRAGQRLKNHAIRLCVAALLSVADRLPERALFAVCRGLGRLARRLFPALERRARARASRVLAAGRAGTVARECFANLGESLAWTLLLRRPSVVARAAVHIDSDARRALSRAGGALVVSAHLGPFEAIAPAVVELGLPAAIVVRESYDPALDALVDAHRLARGVEVIHRGDPGAGPRIVRALRNGKLVGVLPDLPARVESVPALFLGGVTSMPVGPARVAQRARVPLLICCLQPFVDRPGFRLDVSQIETAGITPETLTQRVADAISDAISRAPAWWPWMADLQNKERAG